MRCRHKTIESRLLRLGGGDRLTWFRCATWEEDQALAQSRICIDCGAWLSLGPSNDAPEAVQIEINAAFIAHRYRDYVEIIEETVDVLTRSPATHRNGDSVDAMWQLALAIATHSESP